MISDARGSHVSPGIYTEERDVTYSVKSLGITSLGLVGETLYGPAFQDVEIENWGEYVDYFGGTSTEKFKGTGLPKYELPYIAKSYLEESKRLHVVRVLGLSGYYAGPVWTLSDTNGNTVVVLRSKIEYGENTGNGVCGNPETPIAKVKEIDYQVYKESLYSEECGETSSTPSDIDRTDRFGLKVTLNDGGTETYNVSLNPNDSNYIYNVLSSNPSTGDTSIYVEAVYESSFNGEINSEVTKTEKETYDAVSAYTINYYKNDDSGSTSSLTFNDKAEFETKYVELSGDSAFTVTSALTTDGIEVDYADYKSQFRYAQTPWIVSDALINSVDSVATLRKLFKFVTVSDGNAANTQVKVSIQNIKPDEGVFDVIVRDFYDTDANPIILERFTKCNLVDGDANYIAFKIGTADGGYVSKSKYISIIMGEGEFKKSIPSGFLGFPMPKYGTQNSDFKLEYNTLYNPAIRSKKQYFGMSNLAGKHGIDTDILSFKGASFYNNGSQDAEPTFLCNGFHMDNALNDLGEDKIYVDGISGYKFSVVASKDGDGNKVTSDSMTPRLINNKLALDSSLYKDVNLRKFTVCFYGGFDGWDVNREKRTNTDNYKSSKYNPQAAEGAERIFEPYSPEIEGAIVDLPTTAITSDYYAYLAGCRVFANPQDIDINIFATPGINWGDNALLTQEIVDIIEDADGGRGGDALYVMAAPNESDSMSAIEAYESADLNTSYACTYFPWVMYYDASNKKYLNLPVTKDVVRNMAATDNTSFPWFAPAGMQRGNVNCVKAAFKTTLADEDMLYEACINPVKSYAQDGVKIWGNKTTYDVDSPLNRVNVRRLMIRVKKLVTEAAKSLIFEQYDETLEKQFRGLVEPILADVKSNRGIIDYRVITESTPETRDQHILPAKILIKPTQALEYISISFVVYPESVSFENE